MSNAYGMYKQARDAAWQVLIDNNIFSLPVDPVNIAKRNSISVIKDSSVHKLRPSEDAVSFLVRSSWYIVYDDSVSSTGRKRFTIAHELGHIFLGHPLKLGFHARTFSTDKPSVESNADIFASRLLAPACVLWALDLHTPEEISKACNISLSAASVRAERMKTLYSRNKFLISPLEQQVYKNFSAFISQNK